MLVQSFLTEPLLRFLINLRINFSDTMVQHAVDIKYQIKYNYVITFFYKAYLHNDLVLFFCFKKSHF